ncbi:MAG: hypothetical protein M1822_002354 [Bathelium mastoideum]|nr:MAG: hypothetical protein M1822_002354 [Bathelium mastoideum]
MELSTTLKSAKICRLYGQGFRSPYSVFPPLFQGNTCLPYTPRDSPCTIGRNARFVVNVSSPTDISSSLAFAQKHNLRSVIKNTGHDLLGKSGGAGALGIWTYHLKDLEFQNYSAKYYVGPSVRLGAGIEGWELVQAAAAHGLKVLSGSCPGVGIAGGYSQGGGHSLLGSLYGLAADNVLEWEVVTAGGQLVIASPTQNSDLYWALSGGGGSTYGVVFSMTIKAWPDGPVAGATLTLNPTNATSEDDIWMAVEAYHTHIVSWYEKGAATAHIAGYRAFELFGLTWPDHTKDDVQNLLLDWQSELDAIGMPYNLTVTWFPTWLKHYSYYLGPLPYGFPYLSQVQGGKLVPKATLSSNLHTLVNAIRDITQDGVFQVLGNGMDVSNTSRAVAGNAVLPAWRQAAYSMIVYARWNWTLAWSENVAIEERITNSIDPLLRSIMPNSGSYLNEANPYQKTWKEDFYGVNYNRLRSIKRNWDPQDRLYAKTAVGSDEWVERSDGRLCKIANSS